MTYLMGIDAKVDEVKKLLLEDEYGEEDQEGP